MIDGQRTTFFHAWNNLGGKTDFLRLVLSYPHLPCLRRVYSVVDLSDVARNASSLRGKPAEEKGSLSRLSALVLGKYRLLWGHFRFFQGASGKIKGMHVQILLISRRSAS